MGQAKNRQAEIAALKMKQVSTLCSSAGLVGIALVANGRTAMTVFVPKDFFKPTDASFEFKAAQLLAGAPYFFDGSKDTAKTYSVACAVFLFSNKQPAAGHYVIEVQSIGPGKPAAVAYRSVSEHEFSQYKAS